MARQTTPQIRLARPVCINRRRKSKPSKALDEVVHAERHLTRAARHSIGAAGAGLAVYARAQRKSRAKKGRRYVFDIIPNAVDGSAVAMRKLTIVPVDLMRAAYSPRARKVMRRGVETGAAALSRLLLH